MSYTVELSRSAERDIRKLERGQQQQVIGRLERLETAPTGGGTKPLSGVLRGVRSLRVGRIRACYEVDEDSRTVVVVAVGHRRDVYTRLERRRGW